VSAFHFIIPHLLLQIMSLMPLPHFVVFWQSKQSLSWQILAEVQLCWRVWEWEWLRPIHWKSRRRMERCVNRLTRTGTLPMRSWLPTMGPCPLMSQCQMPGRDLRFLIKRIGQNLFPEKRSKMGEKWEKEFTEDRNGSQQVVL